MKSKDCKIRLFITVRTASLYDLSVLSSEFCTTSDHFKIVHIQEHVLPLHDLTMLNSAVSSAQHQITLR